LEAGLQGILGSLEALILGGELGADEDLGARDPGRGDGPADGGLVAVGGRGVDQADADLERGRHRMFGLLVGQIADADAEDRDGVLVVEGRVGDRCRRGHVTYPVKLNVRGSGPSRVPSSSDAMDSMSCSLSSKSNTSKLLTIRSGLTDLGMTILPSWMCHLI